jgi:WD40 repeat protein
MRTNILPDEEQSLDELVIRARKDNTLKQLIEGKPENVVLNSGNYQFVAQAPFDPFCGIDFCRCYAIGKVQDKLTAFYFDPSEGFREMLKIEDTEKVIDVALHKRGIVAAIDTDNKVKLWKPVSSSKYKLVFDLPETYREKPTNISIFNDNLVVCCDDSIKLYEIVDENATAGIRWIQSTPHTGVKSAAYMTKDRLVFGDAKGRVSVNDDGDCTFLGGYPIYNSKHIDLPRDIKTVAGCGDYIAAINWDRNMYILEYSRKGIEKVLGVPEDSYGVAFSENGKYLLTSCNLYERK